MEIPYAYDGSTTVLSRASRNSAWHLLARAQKQSGGSELGPCGAGTKEFCFVAGSSRGSTRLGLFPQTLTGTRKLSSRHLQAFLAGHAATGWHTGRHREHHSRLLYAVLSKSKHQTLPGRPGSHPGSNTIYFRRPGHRGFSH